ncbi:MAG: DUF3857 domain-containing protein, partial [bacterium]
MARHGVYRLLLQLLLLLLVALALGAASTPQPATAKDLKGDDQRFATPEFWQEAQALFGDYGGGWWLRGKSNSIRYEGGNWFVQETHHYQLVVLDADKMQEYADWTVDVGPTSRISDLKARTIRPTGEVLRLESKNVYEKSRFPGFMLYSDTKAKVFAMPGFADTCVIDVSYVRTDQALYFQDSFEFSGLLPVRQADYAYQVDVGLIGAGFKIYYMSWNVPPTPKYQVLETIMGKFHQWAWQGRDLKAFPEERWMPPREELVPRIIVSGFAPGRPKDDWSAFTDWYSDVLPNFDKPHSDLAPVAAQLAEGGASQSEILRRLVAFFGEKVRYVAVDLKNSGLKPHR